MILLYPKGSENNDLQSIFFLSERNDLQSIRNVEGYD